MPLNTIIESLEELPEALHEFYVESDGKYVLAVDDIDDHPTVKALKNAHDRGKDERKKLLDEKKKLEGKQSEFPDDFSVDEWDRLREMEATIAAHEDDDHKGDGDDADKANGKAKAKASGEKLASMQKLHQDKLDRERKKYESSLAEKDEVIASKTALLIRRVAKEELTKALIENHVTKSLLAAAIALHSPKVKVVEDEEGELLPVVATEDEGDVPVARYISGWAQSDEGKPFVELPKGGGGTGGGGSGKASGPNPFAKDTEHLTKQGQIIRSDPDKARNMMRMADWSDDKIAKRLGE